MVQQPQILGFGKKWLILVMIALLPFAGAACSGKKPSPKTAQSTTLSFFKHYGKRYKDSSFGKSPVTNVTINGVRQVSYNHAEVDAFLALTNGEIARTLITMKNRPPLGWAITSWELIAFRE